MRGRRRWRLVEVDVETWWAIHGEQEIRVAFKLRLGVDSGHSNGEEEVRERESVQGKAEAHEGSRAGIPGRRNGRADGTRGRGAGDA